MGSAVCYAAVLFGCVEIRFGVPLAFIAARNPTSRLCGGKLLPIEISKVGQTWQGLVSSPAPFAFRREQNYVPCCHPRQHLGDCHGSGRCLHGVRCVSSGLGPQTSLSEEGWNEESSTSPYRKRKVALWIGYVGTAFKGLQIVRGPGAVNTVEHELEQAIYKAGGILDTNYGHLDKVCWSRSSRTDKGVHSLATVISMKLEVPPSAWTGDPDGLILADRINAHLPPAIQVFGIVPVTKSFNARRFCCHRTYHYLLPASLMGISRNSSPEKIGQIVDDLRSILSMFQGRYAFHNYTIRSLYRSAGKGKKPRLKRDRCLSTPAPVKNDVVEFEDSLDEDEFDEDTDLYNASKKVSSLKTKDVRIVEQRKAYWLDSPDSSDKLSGSHFRRILDCSCGGLENYGGAQFVRISITGESFMVHQIRKMVATAVAVLNGVLPIDIIPLSLCRHARVVLPIAPSEGLVLAKNSFHPYRQLQTPAFEREFRESDVGLSRLQELPKLELTRRMSRNVDIFWQDVVLPELALHLDGSIPVWSVWQENLSQAKISEIEVKELHTSYTNWRTISQLKMEAESQLHLLNAVGVSMVKEMDIE